MRVEDAEQGGGQGDGGDGLRLEQAFEFVDGRPGCPGARG